jgi:hypothetical protein
MPLPKPRVKISVNSITAKLTWDNVPGASSYKVYYTLHNSNEKINQLSVRHPAVIIKNLKPETNYTAFVSCINITHICPPTIINFKTNEVILMESLGSGTSLYATLPIESDDEKSLVTTSTGFTFGPSDTGLFVMSHFFKFATFSLGNITDKTHISFRLLDPSGDWLLNGSILQDTILHVMVENETGWLNANALYVAPISDFQDGGRVLTLSTDPHVRNITFGHNSMSGNVLVRLGINFVGYRQFSGISLQTSNEVTNTTPSISRQVSHSSLT